MQNKTTQPQLTPAQISDKLQEMLRPSGWHNLLKGFLVSEDFEKIIHTLQELVKDDKRFTPPLKQVFRAFQECPISELKVVIVGQDPYPQLGVADGIAFSCGNTLKREASLRYIHKAIANTVYADKLDFKDMNPDLVTWSNQGILLMNTSLTTEINKIGKHFDIWKAFTQYLIDMLNANGKPLVWVFLGKKAQEYSDLVDDSHIKLYASHPASAAYQKEQMWNCDDVFNQINVSLLKLEYPQVKWHI
jgi:uracil-DNA glycosylase